MEIERFKLAKYLRLSVILLFVTSASAQPVPNDNEVQAALGFFHAQDADSGNLNADLGYGKFLDDNHWEVGGRLGYQGVYADNARDVWNVSLVPFVDYHFLNVSKENRVVPFLGALAGITFNDDDFDGVLGPEVGAKFFMNRQTFAGLRYRYEWFFNDIDLGDEASDGNHVLTIALGYLWGGEGSAR